MSLLEVDKISFKYADESLYQDASMRLFEGDHAVLVGPNGTGKSTLLKLIYKLQSPDQGKINWVNHIVVGYLDQYADVDAKMLVKTYIYDVFLPLFEKEQQQMRLYESIAYEPESKHEKILNRAHHITEALEKADFYAISSKIGNVLNGLGLGIDLLDTPIGFLSGGMRAKLILAKLLLEEADVLLLDEPTNFLDVEHVEWLIKFLNGFKKTFIVISHDEEFLKQIATCVFAVENRQITRYKGNYDFYLSERVIRFEIQQKQYEGQQKFIKQTEDFIDKNIVRKSTTRRAQSRRKMLEKIVKIDKPIINKSIHFNFLMGRTTGIDVLKVNRLEIGYEQPLIEPIDFVIRKGDKVAITGRNGVGKSTLLKTLLGNKEALSGSYQWIDTAEILYFEQDISFDQSYTAFEMIHYDAPELDRKGVMSVLARYGIDFEMANRPVGTLSGGERSKVKFALLRNHKSNVLILDEPTNHLDVIAKESLKKALSDYAGTLILVSHEKEFYQDICDYEITLYSE